MQCLLPLRPWRLARGSVGISSRRKTAIASAHREIRLWEIVEMTYPARSRRSDLTLDPLQECALARGAAIASLVVLAALGFSAWWFNRRPSPPKQFELAVEVTPAGAEITIDGVAAERAPMKKSLAGGEYRVEARQRGLRNAATTVTVGPQSSGKVALAMEVDGIPVHFVTDYRGPAVTLNGKPFVDEEQKGSVNGMLSLNDGSYVLGVRFGGTLPLGLS